MILTVTLNLALDLTYRVPRVQWRSTNRVDLVGRRAGGKGVNAARVLHTLGRDLVVTGLVGGFTGAAARAELEASGLADRTVPIGGDSRITIIVAEHDGEVTGFSERGPQVTSEEWRHMQTRFRSLVQAARGVVLSGSLPPGVPSNAYGRE